MNSHNKEEQIEVPDELQLPEEIQVAFFSYLESHDLAKITRVNKLWMTLSNDSSLWNFLLMKDFGLDYPKFLKDLKAEQPLATSSDSPSLHPKEVYKLYKYLSNLFIELANTPSLKDDNSFRNLLAIRKPEPLTKAIDNFNNLSHAQKSTLFNMYAVSDFTSITKIGNLLDKIYQLVQQHFELAMLLMSDHSAINNNTDIKISNRNLLYLLLKKHLDKISVVDLSTLAFTDASDCKVDFFALFEELFAKPNCKVTKVILSTASDRFDFTIDYYCNSFTRMPNLHEIVIKCKADEFKQQIATLGPKFQKLLQDHPNIQTITIVAIDDASKVYTLQKANLEKNQNNMETEETKSFTPKL